MKQETQKKIAKWVVLAYIGAFVLSFLGVIIVSAIQNYGMVGLLVVIGAFALIALLCWAVGALVADRDGIY